MNTVFRTIDDLEGGVTVVNAPTIGAGIHLPWGGVKDSGNGGREAGTAAIGGFTETKTLYIDYSERLQKALILATRSHRGETEALPNGQDRCSERGGHP